MFLLTYNIEQYYLKICFTDECKIEIYIHSVNKSKWAHLEAITLQIIYMHIFIEIMQQVHSWEKSKFFYITNWSVRYQEENGYDIEYFLEFFSIYCDTINSAPDENESTSYHTYVDVFKKFQMRSAIGSAYVIIRYAKQGKQCTKKNSGQ